MPSSDSALVAASGVRWVSVRSFERCTADDNDGKNVHNNDGPRLH